MNARLALVRLVFASLSAWLGILPQSLAAQPAFLDRIALRHNLNTSKEIAQPALIQFTWPEDEPAVVVVNAGAKATLFPGDFDIGPFAEYQRNTATEKEQDALRLGADLYWQVRPSPIVLPGTDPSFSSPLVFGQVNYKRDGVEDESSAEASLLFSYVAKSSRRFPLPNTLFSLGDRALDFTYAPYLGVEVESGDSTRARGVARLDAAAYPAGRLLRQRLELVGQLAYRVGLGEVDSAEEGALVRAEINVYAFDDGKRKGGLGLTYVRGDDPTKDLVGQQYWQFGIKLQLK